MQIKKFLKSSSFVYTLLFLYAFLLSLMSSCSPFTKFEPWGDSAAYMYNGYAMARGLTPYVDIYYGQVPFMRLVNYIGWLLGGKWGIWLFELIFMTAGLIFGYKIARLYASKIAAAAATVAVYSLMIVYLRNGNLTEEYALPFMIIGLYLILKFFKSDNLSRLQLIGIGATCAAAFNFKINMVLLWGIFFVAILIRMIVLKRYKDIFKYLGFVILGFFAVELPIIIYLLSVNAFSTYFSVNITGIFTYASNSAGSGRLFTALEYFLLSALPFFVLCAAYFICKLIFKRKENSEIFLDYSLLALLIFSYIGISVIGNTYEHYAIQLIPCFLVPTAWVFGKLEKAIAQNGKKLVVVMSILLLIGICGQSLYQLPKINYEMLTAEEDRTTADMIQRFTTKDDKIIVLGFQCYLYMQSDRLAASKYYYQLPGSMFEDTRAEFFNEIKQNRPKLIVICQQQILVDYPAIYEGLADFVAENYTEVNSPAGYAFYSLSE